MEPLEIGEPDLDERAHDLLEPGLARDGERLLVALPCLLRRDALLQAIVARDEQLLDPLPRVGALHERTLFMAPIVRDLMEAAVHPRSALRVLIADDEPHFVEMVEGMLAEDERIELVGTARDGEEAVALALAHTPDVIVMDISMPVLDGIEAARQIHENDPDARILILTGLSTSADIDRSQTAGVAGFLTKDRINSHLVSSILDLGAC